MSIRAIESAELTKGFIHIGCVCGLLLAISAASAFAQSAIPPDASAPDNGTPATGAAPQNEPSQGPTSHYDATKTTQTVYGPGTVSTTRQSYAKDQNITSGDGQLRAETKVKTSGSASTTTTTQSPNLPQENR